MIVIEKKNKQEVWGERELGLLAGISENITPIEPTDEENVPDFEALIAEVLGE